MLPVKAALERPIAQATSQRACVRVCQTNPVHPTPTLARLPVPLIVTLACRYFIPILGMMLGNTVSSISVVLSAALDNVVQGGYIPASYALPYLIPQHPHRHGHTATPSQTPPA